MVRGTGSQYEGSFKRPRGACVAAPLAVRARRDFPREVRFTARGRGCLLRRSAHGRCSPGGAHDQDREGVAARADASRVACGSRAGGGSASSRDAVASGTSTDGGGGTGSAPSCATLLPASVRPEVFVLPEDTWVQQRQSILRCDTEDFAASDSSGNLAFLAATVWEPGPGCPDLRDESSDRSDSDRRCRGDVRPAWTAGVQGLTAGFLGGLFFTAASRGVPPRLVRARRTSHGRST